MATLASRRECARLALLAVGLALLIVAPGCSAEARARRSLKKVEYREINQFNKYHQRKVKPKVYESGGGFYRTYHERVDPVLNMRRTNSIDTPYVATLSFTENIYRTRRRSTMKESRRDSHYILASTNKREIVYTFAGGSWKRKEVY